MKDNSEAISARPLSSVMGAEVDIDLTRPISESAFQAILGFLHRYQVLAFRDQRITPADQVAFSRRFGPIAGHVLKGWSRGEFPEIHVLTNLDEQGNITGRLPDSAAFFAPGEKGYSGKFHTDKSYMAAPALVTTLYGVEVPSSGADTLFADMYRAYEALPPDLLAEIRDRSAIHSLDQSRINGRPPTDEERRAAPPVAHPLVRLHPVTRRKVIYCGTHAESIVGLPPDAGRDLIDRLNAFATQAEFIYRHQWKQYDLVVWDNRCVLHAATPFDIARERRLMRRTVVEQTQP